jgi:N-acetylneuraminate synthase
VPAFKIASFELVDLALISHAARSGLPLIMSTGMATVAEIGEAIETARSAACGELMLLHCVSGYPTPVEESRITTIGDLSSRFRIPVGLSDHTLGTAVAVAAVALGAVAIEKHVTLDRAEGGVDAAFSLEPHELARLVTEVKQSWSSLGRPDYQRSPSEVSNVKFRRSIYVVSDIAAGESFDNRNLRVIRPGYGMAPRYLPMVLGRRATKDLARGTALTGDAIEDWNPQER